MHVEQRSHARGHHDDGRAAVLPLRRLRSVGRHLPPVLLAAADIPLCLRRCIWPAAGPLLRGRGRRRRALLLLRGWRRHAVCCRPGGLEAHLHTQLCRTQLLQRRILLRLTLVTARGPHRQCRLCGEQGGGKEGRVLAKVASG